MQVGKLQQENSQQDKHIQKLNTNVNTKLRILKNKNSQQDNQIQNLNTYTNKKLKILSQKILQQEKQIQSLEVKLKKIDRKQNSKSD